MAAPVRTDRGELQGGMGASLNQAAGLRDISVQEASEVRAHDLLQQGMEVLQISPTNLRGRQGSITPSECKVTNKEDLFEFLFESRRPPSAESCANAPQKKAKNQSCEWLPILEALDERRRNLNPTRQEENNVINQTVVSPAFQFSSMRFFLIRAMGTTVLFATSNRDEIKDLVGDPSTLEFKPQFSSDNFGLADLPDRVEDGTKVTLMTDELWRVFDEIASDESSPYHDRMTEAFRRSRQPQTNRNQGPEGDLLVMQLPTDVKKNLKTVGDLKRAMFEGSDHDDLRYSPLIKWRSNNKEDQQIRKAQKEAWGHLTNSQAKAARTMLSSLYADTAFMLLAHHKCKTFPDNMTFGTSGPNMTEIQNAAKAYFIPTSKERANCAAFMGKYLPGQQLPKATDTYCAFLAAKDARTNKARGYWDLLCFVKDKISSS